MAALVGNALIKVADTPLYNPEGGLNVKLIDQLLGGADISLQRKSSKRAGTVVNHVRSWLLSRTEKSHTSPSGLGFHALETSVRAGVLSGPIHSINLYPTLNYVYLKCNGVRRVVLISCQSRANYITRLPSLKSPILDIFSLTYRIVDTPGQHSTNPPGQNHVHGRQLVYSFMRTSKPLDHPFVPEL